MITAGDPVRVTSGFPELAGKQLQAVATYDFGGPMGRLVDVRIVGDPQAGVWQVPAQRLTRGGANDA